MGVKFDKSQYAELQRFLKKTENLFEKKDFLIELTDQIYNQARENAPVRTGKLQRNITQEISGFQGKVYEANNGMLRGGINYAFFVHFGTTDHFIKPNKKKALRFSVGGKFYFSKGHKVRGIKANPFLYKALDQVEARAELIFNKITGDLEK